MRDRKVALFIDHLPEGVWELNCHPIGSYALRPSLRCAWPRPLRGAGASFFRSVRVCLATSATPGGTSLEAEALKLTVWPLSAGFGVALKEAVGARFVIVRLRVVSFVAPSLSVTRSPTVTAPASQGFALISGLVTGAGQYDFFVADSAATQQTTSFHIKCC